MRKGLKAALISVVCLIVAAAILVGVLWYIGRDTTPVNVYAVENFSMLGMYVGGDYYYGPVRSDNLQSVFVSDTQIVTEVLVSEGQTVKKGDALLHYDTTLSDIQLERQEIAVQQAKLSYENAQKELKEINSMKPYSPPPATVAPTEPSTEPLTPVEELPYLYGGKGTQKSPYRIIWSEELTYDEAYLLELMGEKTDAWFAFEIREENAVKGELLSRFGLHVTVYTTTVGEPTEPPTTDPTPDESTEPTVTEEMPTESSEPTTTEETPSETDEPTTTETTPSESDEPSEGETQPATRAATRTATVEKHIYYSFFTPTDEPIEDDGDVDEPDVWVDDSSGYTSAEIAQMRAEKQKEIRDCDLKYRMAQVDLKRMQAEVDGGTVYAKLDGTITMLVDEQTARDNGSAILVLSGGGRYYIDIAVDEFTCQTLTVGTPITAQTWWPETATYEGQIEEITTTPASQDYYSGTGNPNATFYKVVVSIPGDAVIQEGTYVDVQLSEGSSSDAWYLQNMFIRYDGSRAYVYKRNADGLLEKCYIQTGSDLWGSYTEIRGGLSQEDWIAFPYGKTVKDGAQTNESTTDEFYNYY